MDDFYDDKLDLDLSGNEYDQEFDLVPPGNYLCETRNAEKKTTQDGRGEYIKVEFHIIDEKYNGRVIFQNYNIINKSETAERIGRGQLKSLLVAGGKEPVLHRVSDLNGLRVLARVKIRKDKTGQYDDQNAISYVKKLSEEQAKSVEETLGNDVIPF